MKVQHWLLGVSALAGAGAVAPAMANDGVSISIYSRVRTVCEVDLGAAARTELQPGINQVGRITELCNNMEGYRLTFAHPTGMEGAWISVDGNRIDLAGDATRTVIVDSTHPGHVQRELAVFLPDGAPAPISLSLYAEAKGPIF